MKQKSAAGSDFTPVPVLGKAGWEVTAGTLGGLPPCGDLPVAMVKPLHLPELCVKHGMLPFLI